MRRAITSILFVLAATPWLFAADDPPPAQSTANYRFTRIDFPGATFTVAFCINARGDVVGSYVDADGASHGYLLRNGQFTAIDVPGAEVTLYARAVNARGDIAGAFLDGDFLAHGYLLRDGQFTQIDVPGAVETIVRGMNNAGDVTGNFIDGDGIENAFIRKDEVFETFLIPNGTSSDVWSAQDNGRVMVGDAAMLPDDQLHGFLRMKSGDFRLIDFPGLPVPCTAPRWINERGDVVGLFGRFHTIDECYAGPPESSYHGFLLRHGVYHSLDVPGAVNTTALAINDDGVIVGRWDDRRGQTHGYTAVPRNDD
jgi:uncharacterized membrane protein